MFSGLKEGVINKSHLTKCPKVTTRETLNARGKTIVIIIIIVFYYFFRGVGWGNFRQKIVDGSHGKNRASDFYYRGPTFVVKKLSCTSYCSPKKSCTLDGLRSHVTFSWVCSLNLKRFSERQNILEVARTVKSCSKCPTLFKRCRAQSGRA